MICGAGEVAALFWRGEGTDVADGLGELVEGCGTAASEVGFQRRDGHSIGEARQENSLGEAVEKVELRRKDQKFYTISCNFQL